jgi:hypothetical protein
VCKTKITAAHTTRIMIVLAEFLRVCVGCGVCETFASDKNEISTGHLGSGQVRDNREFLAKRNLLTFPLF